MKQTKKLKERDYKERQKISHLISDSKGITLIALVITIIVMLILVAVTINIVAQGGLFDSASEATFKTELSKLQEELEIYKMTKLTEFGEKFEATSLTASTSRLYYDPVGETEGNIEEVMPSISEKMKKKIEVLNGEILFLGSEKEIKWAKELEINKVVKIRDGELLSDDDNLSILSTDGTFTVPSTVRVIGEGAFSNVEGIKKVIIPYTVKEIAKNAFSGNSSIEEVEIQTKNGEGLEKIGVRAFASCKGLKEINIPNTVNEIGNAAFNTCSKLSNVTLSNNVKILNNLVFANCTALTSIDIPEGVVNIGESCFTTCTNLTKVTIPLTVTSINNRAFEQCTSLRDITISDKNTKYAMVNGILMNAGKTDMIFMLENAKAIEGNTFTVPNGVTSMPTYFLDSHPNITKVIIPASVKSITALTFSSKVSEIVIDSLNNNYKVEDGVIYSKDDTVLVHYFKNAEGTVTVKDGIKKIQGYAFDRRAKKITNLNLPYSLTTLEWGAITCPKVTSLALGKEVSSINAGAFDESGITKLKIDPENINYSFEDGALYNYNKTKLIVLIDRSLTEFDMPNTVTTIGTRAFYHCNKLTKITLSNKLSIIETNAFSPCTGLTSLSIPNTITSIGKDAFSGCPNLKVQIDVEENAIPGAPWGLPSGARGIEWKK